MQKKQHMMYLHFHTFHTLKLNVHLFLYVAINKQKHSTSSHAVLFHAIPSHPACNSTAGVSEDSLGFTPRGQADSHTGRK